MFSSLNPPSGNGFGATSLLSTPVIDYTYRGTNCVPYVSFWLYRDATAAFFSPDDQINIYVNTSPSTVSGGTLLGSIYRCITGTPAVSATGWYQYSYAIPASYTSATNYIIFQGIADENANMYIDDVTYTSYPSSTYSPMTYSSSTTTQTATSSVSPGATSQQMIGIEVATANCGTPLTLTDLMLSTNGSTSAGDITNANVWYTGNSNTFATTSQFGTTITSPSGAFRVTGNQVLQGGTNYFWLTYDVAASANNGDYLDAECSSIIIGGSSYIPTVTAPAGKQVC